MTTVSQWSATRRWLASIAVALGVALLLASATTRAMPGSALVMAQESPPLSCADFVTQRAAQALLDADPSYGPNVDPDEDGLACEDLPATLVFITVAVPSDSTAAAADPPVATSTRAATSTPPPTATAEPTTEPTATAEPTATIEATARAIATVEPAATPGDGPTIITRQRPTATPVDPAPIIAPDPGAADAPLYGRFGSPREGFETVYGEPIAAEPAEYPLGSDYAVTGFDLVTAAYHRDYVNALTIALPGPVGRDEAETLIERFLPADTQRGGVRVETTSGDLVVSATSAALVDRYGAATYELYDAAGDRGTFHYRLRGDDDGTYSMVEIRLGTGRGSAPDSTGTAEIAATPPSGTAPATDATATAAADAGTAAADSDSDTDPTAYLAAVQTDYDALIGSLSAFAALIGAPPADSTETYLAALVAECAVWQSTAAAAAELVPPPDYADLHADYLAFTGLLDDAAAEIISGIETDDPAAVEAGIAQVVRATALIAPIDEALAAAGDARG
ncbi:MAG: hypothetical protein WKF80_03815 [Thermomicrobiales bacterium]